MSEWKFYIREDPMLRDPALFLGKRYENGEIDVVTGIQYTRIGLYEQAPQEMPFVSPSSDVEGFLRAALNCAWERGLRPDGFNDTRESMKATKAHLDDMRALAFHKIGAAKP